MKFTFNLRDLLCSSLRFLLTFSIAFIAVLALIWSLTRWANYDPPIETDPDGVITLSASAATLHGPPQIKLEFVASEKNIGYWDYDSQWLSWDTDIQKTGSYTVTLRYARPGGVSVELHLTVGSDHLDASAPGTGSWSDWETMELGTIRISKSGKQTIRLKASNLPSEGVINFIHLKITPLE